LDFIIFAFAFDYSFGADYFQVASALLAAGTEIAGKIYQNTAIIERMVEQDLNFGISHERITVELPERFVWGVLPDQKEIPTNIKLKEITEKHNLAIHQFHSNIDKAAWGMPVALLENLGWQDYPADWNVGIPVVTIPEIRLKDLVAHLKKALDVPFIRYDGDDNKIIKRIAISWGGLCQGYSGFVCPHPLGIDAIMGGDILDGVVRIARDTDVAVIDAWHHRTEMDAMRVCAEKLRAKFPDLNVVFFENDVPWKLG